MKEKALEYFKNGYSCSESIVAAAIDEGLCDKSLLAVATSFSGGMSSGCLCGAIAGAQIVIGYLFGRDNSKGNKQVARALAKEVIDLFKEKHKVTCCRTLTADFEMGSPERKQNCTNMVSDCAQILEKLVGEKVCWFSALSNLYSITKKEFIKND